MLRENPVFSLIKKYVYVSIKRLKSHVTVFPILQKVGLNSSFYKELTSPRVEFLRFCLFVCLCLT